MPDGGHRAGGSALAVASGLPVPQTQMLPPPSSAIGVPGTAFEEFA